MIDFILFLYFNMFLLNTIIEIKRCLALFAKHRFIHITIIR